VEEKMEKQVEYLGSKIKKLSKHLADRALVISREETDPSFALNSIENHHYMHEYLFGFLGEYLCTKDELMNHDLITFANLFSHKSVGKLSSLNISINLVHFSRLVINEFLEEEINQNTISTKTLFEVVRMFGPLYQLIVNTIIDHFNNLLSSTQFALNESTKDLKITLQELADLKNALNEATIFAITDKNDMITYANEKFCEVSKYTKEELFGQPHNILNSNYHPKEFFENVLQTIQRGEIWKGEILNKAKDGTFYWVDTTIVPFVDQFGDTYQHISIQYDITEKKKAEEMLLKAEKLSMVGELAAGIAHEIRNPLTTVKGFVQLLTETDGSRMYADTILSEIDRINFIVSEFMVFAKPHTRYFTECNLREILKSIILFLEPEALLKNVDLISMITKQDVLISGEKNQLKQVFLNMIKNAIEAMPNGGKVVISLTSSMAGIIVSIKDTGAGMTPDQVKRIGEPFYTTKSGGNGLGLMVSFKIIQDHRGTIEIESVHGEGTKFIIKFPVYSDL
jgi:PAS domain S-box-containing protein